MPHWRHHDDPEQRTPAGLVVPGRVATLRKRPMGMTAVDLDVVASGGHQSLAKNAGHANQSLKKRGMAGLVAQVRLYPDFSQSMEWPGREYYTGRDHVVQTLVEYALAFGLTVDKDGSIPVLAFDSVLHEEIDVNLDTYRGVVDREIVRRFRMGGTVYSNVLRDLIDQGKRTDDPILGVMVTDGDPNDPDEAEELVCELSRYPVFLKILAVEDVPYLDELDDLKDRRPNDVLVDAVDAKAFNGQRDHDTGITWPRVRDLTPEIFAEAMADEWDKWLNTSPTVSGTL